MMNCVAVFSGQSAGGVEQACSGPGFVGCTEAETPALLAPPVPDAMTAIATAHTARAARPQILFIAPPLVAMSLVPQSGGQFKASALVPLAMIRDGSRSWWPGGKSR